MAVGQHDVVRFDIPVNNILFVGVGQSIHHIPEDPNSFCNWEFTLHSQLRSQRPPFFIGHDIVKEAIGFPRIEEWKNVWVVKARSDFDLLKKALFAKCGGQLGAEDLHCDLAVMFEVLGKVDRGHPARSDFSLDAVATGQ
jgi:hypothetical protein